MKEAIKHFCGRQWFLLSMVVVMAVLVMAFFYFDDGGGEGVASRNTYFLSNNLKIVEKDGSRFVINKVNEIEIEIEKNWDILFSSEKELSLGPKNQNEGYSTEGFEIIIHDLHETIDISNWLLTWIADSNCPNCYSTPVEESPVLYRIDDTGSLGEIINYFWITNDLIYQITYFDSSKNINHFLKKIKL